ELGEVPVRLDEGLLDQVRSPPFGLQVGGQFLPGDQQQVALARLEHAPEGLEGAGPGGGEVPHSLFPGFSHPLPSSAREGGRTDAPRGPAGRSPPSAGRHVAQGPVSTIRTPRSTFSGGSRAFFELGRTEGSRRMAKRARRWTTYLARAGHVAHCRTKGLHT